MIRLFAVLSFFVSWANLVQNVSAFSPGLVNQFGHRSICVDQSVKQKGRLQASRRSFAQELVTSSLFTAVLTTLSTPSALASGGATAGGAYLLSAKQRYNDRVKQGVNGFLALSSPLESGDIDAVRAFFTSEEVGSWKDLSTAGYLLANAFRRNSTAAPDSLPSVKKWKEFAAEVEQITKALKKKDTTAARAEYQEALAALDEYLAKVELDRS